MDALFENVGKTRGLAIMILDMFEDMLEEKGIIMMKEMRYSTNSSTLWEIIQAHADTRFIPSS